MAIQLTPQPGSMEHFQSTTIQGAPEPISTAAPQSSYQPIFNYTNMSQLDADPTGENTLLYGQRTGQPVTRDTILELNVGGRIMSADQLRAVEGGDALLELAKKNRQGRKGFWGGLSEGADTDFLPFINDIASVGIAVRNMSKLRDALKKVQDEGPDSLTDQERVFVSLYEQDSMRNQNGTWGSTVGSIIRQAPAFGLEIAATVLTGGAAGTAMVGGKLAGKAAKEGAEELITTGARRLAESSVKKMLRETMKKEGVERAMLKMTDEAFKEVAEKATVDAFEKLSGKFAKEFGEEGVTAAMESRVRTAAKSAAEAHLLAFKNPKVVDAWKNFFVEYGKKGVMLQYDDIIGESMEKSVKDRLRDFAGVALVEAPIKGAIVGTFDYAVANPIAARLLGADEAVTKSELMFASSQDKDIREGAKFWAWGASLAEYGSEFSGGAFNALGSIVKDSALAAAGRGMVSKGLRAVTPKSMGRFVDEVITRSSGSGKAIKGALEGMKRDAVETIASLGDDVTDPKMIGLKSRMIGKSVDEVLSSDPKLVEDIMKTTLDARTMSFLGYVMSDKMINMGLTPEKISKLYKGMGYDEILGEFMEERYNGFAQGLFGLDGSAEDSKGVMGRLAYAAQAALPETAGKGFAEIVAFALPMVGRAALNRMHYQLGAGQLSNIQAFVDGLHTTTESNKGTVSTEVAGRPGNANEVQPVEKPDSSAAEVTGKLGKVRASRQALLTETIEKLNQRYFDAVKVSNELSEIKEGPLKTGARMILKISEAMLTGNPFALFNDPMKAIAYDRLGNDGSELYKRGQSVYSFLFKETARRLALQDAKALPTGAATGDEVLTDNEIGSFIANSKNRQRIEKEVEPLAKAYLSDITSQYLASHGALFVDEAMLDRQMARIMNQRERLGQKMTAEEAEAFRKQHKEQLAEMAKGKLRWDERVAGRGAFVVTRTNDKSENDVFRSIDEMLHAEFGMLSYLDLSQTNDPKNNLSGMGTIINRDLIDKAAAGDIAASLQYARESGLSFGRSISEASEANMLAKVKAHAMQMQALEDLLLPQYTTVTPGAPTSIVSVERTADGKYRTTGPTKYEGKDFLSVEKQLLDAGFARTRRNIVMTPQLGMWSRHASSFFHPMAPRIGLYDTGAVERMREAKSPYLAEEFKDDYAGARAEAERQIKESMDKNGEMPAWEKIAGDIMKSYNADNHDNPVRRGDKGYFLSFGGLNDADNIYIPRNARGGNNIIHVIEEVLENRLKGGGYAVLEMRDEKTGLMTYRPAVEDFFNKVRAEALRYEKEQRDIVAGGTYDAPYALEQADRAARVANLFNTRDEKGNPILPNLEAMSKALSSYGLMMAVNPSNVDGAAYYSTLASIARSVIGTDEHMAFMSITHRFIEPAGAMTGTPVGEVNMLNEGGGYLAQVMRRLAPANVRDTEVPGMPGVKGALEVPAAAGKELQDLVARARSGEYGAENVAPENRQAFADTVKALYGKVGQTPGAYFPEDIPALVKQLSSGFGAGNVQQDQQTPAEQAADVKEVAAKNEAKGKKDAGKDAENGVEKNGQDPSIVEALRNPQMAMLMMTYAQVAIGRKGLVFGGKIKPTKMRLNDDTDLKTLFDFWKDYSPNLSDAEFDIVKEAVRKEIPAGPMEADDSDALSADGEGYSMTADNAARDYLAKNPQVGALKTIMETFTGLRELSSVVRMLYSLDLTKEGTYEPDSITALFDGKPHENPHQAMGTSEEFKSWLQSQLGKTPVTERNRLAFLTALEALGPEGSYRLLTDIRGVTPVGGMRLTEDLTGNVADVVNREDIIDTNSLGDERTTINVQISQATVTDADKATRMADAVKLTPAPAIFRKKGAEVNNANVGAVMDQMAKYIPAFDRLLGKDNYISLALASRTTAVNLIRRNLVNGLLFTYTFDNGGTIKNGSALFQMLNAAHKALADGKTTREAADAMFDRGFQTTAKGTVSDQRGPLNNFLATYAPAHLKDTVRRLGGQGSVKLTAPAKSLVMEKFLGSQQFADHIRADGSRSKSEFEVASRTATYLDGTPVFWNVTGQTVKNAVVGEDEKGNPIRRDKKVAEPSARMVLRAARQMSTARNEFYLPLFRSDKSNILGVTVPMKLAEAISGKKNPTFNEAYKAVTKMLGMDKFAAKRAAQVVQGFGAALEVAPKTTLAAFLPSDASVPSALDESTIGQATVAGPVVDAAKRAMAEKNATAFKLHILSLANGGYLFNKGLFHQALEKDPAMTGAQKFIDKLAQKFVEANGQSAVVDSLDGYKEGRLNSKFNGVLVNGKAMPAALFIRNNKEVNESTVVTWKDAGMEPVEGPLSQFLPDLKIQRAVETEEGGMPVDVISYTEEVTWRKAASVFHGAKPEDGDVSKNIGRDPGLEAATIRAVSDMIMLAHAAAHPESIKAFAPREKRLEAKLASGEIPALSAIFSEQTQMSAATSRILSSELGYILDAACKQGGGRTVDGKEIPVVGKDSVYSAPAAKIDNPEEFDGREVRAAVIALNLREPGMRGTSLMLDTGHKAFAGLDDRRMVLAIKERLDNLNAIAASNVENRNSAYNQYLLEEVMPLFTDLEGKPLPEGTVYSFADLYDSRGFDMTAFRWGDASPTGMPILDGVAGLAIRTPSGDPAAWTKVRVYGPVSTVEGQGGLRVTTDENGKYILNRTSAEGEKTVVSADEALIRLHANVLVQTGHDNDGDKLRVHFAHETGFGQYARFDMTDPKAVEDAVASVSDPDAKKAAKELDRLTRRLQNAWFDSAMRWWEGEFTAGLTPTGPISFSDADAADLAAVAKSAGYAEIKFDPTDPDSAAEGSDLGYNGSKGRGIGVSNLGNFDIVRNVLQGVSPEKDDTPFFAAPLSNGKQIKVDFSKLPTDSQWRFVRSILFARNNLLFDVMKNFGVDVRYGFTQPLMTLHDALLYANADAIQTKEDYVSFLKLWLRFAHGAPGKAITQRWLADSDPSVDVPTRTPQATNRINAKLFGLKAAADGSMVINFPAPMAKIGAGARRNVTEATIAYKNAGGKLAPYDFAEKVARLYQFAEGAGYLKAVIEVDEKQLNSPAAQAKFTDTLDKASQFAGTLVAPKDGIRAFETFAKNAIMKRDMAAEAFAGSYEHSALAAALADEDYSFADAAHRAALASAAASYAPALLKGKLGDLATASPSVFKSTVESVFKAMFDNVYYWKRTGDTAVKSDLRGTIPFLDALFVMPSEGRNRPGYIRPIAADDTDAGQAALAQSARWLRDQSGDTLNVTLSIINRNGPQKQTFTGNDLYHMLRIYTAMFGDPSYRISARNVSFLPYFGADEMRELLVRQVRFYNDPNMIKSFAGAVNTTADRFNTDEDTRIPVVGALPFGVADKVADEAWYSEFEKGKRIDKYAKDVIAAEAEREQAMREENVPAAPTMKIEAPAAEVVEAGPVAEMPDSFDSIGRDGQPIKIYRDETIGWVAQDPATSENVPIKESAAEYYFKRSGLKAGDVAPLKPAEAVMAEADQARAALWDLVAASKKSKGGLKDIMANTQNRIAWMAVHLGANDSHWQAAVKTVEAMKQAKRMPLLQAYPGAYSAITDAAAEAVMKLGAAPELVNGFFLALGLETRANGLSNEEGPRKDLLAFIKETGADPRSNTDLLKPANFHDYFATQNPLMKVLVATTVSTPGISSTAKGTYAAARKIYDGLAPVVNQELLGGVTASINSEPGKVEKLLNEWSDYTGNRQENGLAGKLPVYPRLFIAEFLQFNNDATRTITRETEGRMSPWNLFRLFLTADDFTALTYLARGVFAKDEYNMAYTNGTLWYNSYTDYTANNDRLAGVKRDQVTRLHQLEALWRAFTGDIRIKAEAQIAELDKAGIDTTVMKQNLADYGVASIGNLVADPAWMVRSLLAGAKKLGFETKGVTEEEYLKALKETLEAQASEAEYVNMINPALAGTAHSILGKAIGYVEERQKSVADRFIASGDIQTVEEMATAATKKESPTASVEDINEKMNRIREMVNEAVTRDAGIIRGIAADDKEHAEFLRLVQSGKARREQGPSDLTKVIHAVLAGGNANEIVEQVEFYMNEIMNNGAYSDIGQAMRKVMDAYMNGGLEMFAALGARKSDSDKRAYGKRMQDLGDAVATRTTTARGTFKTRIPDLLRRAAAKLENITDPDEKEMERARLEKLNNDWRAAKLIARTAASAVYTSQEARANLVGAAAQSDADIKRPDGSEVPKPQPSAMEAQAINELGSPWDPMTAHVHVMDTDVFMAGAVAPYFRGFGIRDILFDKEALAALPYATSVANYISGYFATRTVSGYIPPMTKVQRRRYKAEDGTWKETDEFDTVTRFDRNKLIQQSAAELAGQTLTDEELDLVRMLETALAFKVCSGLGNDSRMVMDKMSLRFTDLPIELKNESAEQYVRRVVTLKQADILAAKIGVAKGEQRMMSLHLTLRALRSAGASADTMEKAERILQDAAAFYIKSEGTPTDRALAAIEYLRGLNVAEVRYDKPRGDASRQVKDAVFAIPIKWIAEEFENSSAKAKLIKAGRAERELDILNPENDLVKRYRDALRRVRGSATTLGVMGASRFMHDAGTASAFFPGTGVHKFNARRPERPTPGALPQELAKLSEELLQTLNGSFYTDRSSGMRRQRPLLADDPGGLRMMSFLIDLHRLDVTPESLIAQIKAGAYAGDNREFTLPRNAGRWDVAKAVYAAGVRRLYEVAMNGGEVKSVKLGEIGLAEFNAMIERTALDNQVDGELPLGATWSDIYELTGALPASMTASEHLANFSQGVATATRYRAAFNNLLMAADEEGMPVVYMKPATTEDDTVPDRMWGQVARWWAQVHSGRDGKGVTYDESLSGRENARRIFDEIDRMKHADGQERGVRAGVERYVFENIAVPEGFGAAERIIATRPRAGDDTQSMFDTAIGGEAAGIVKQVLAIPNFGRDDTKTAWVNNVLSWSKSSSVMASLFFPIATSIESPWAANGFFSTFMGLSERMSKLGRKTGLTEDSPMMKEFFNLIGSDSDFLVDNMVLQTLCGIEFANRAKNMMDHDRTAISRDINSAVKLAENTFGKKAGRNLRIMLDGAMQNPSEFAFEYIINATKMAVFAQTSAKMRRKALEAGRWWDPVRSMLPYANYINAEVGGIDPAMYAWMTPTAQKWLKVLMFSAPWTFGAWEAGGGGVLTQKLFGRTTTPEIRSFMAGRWARMYFGVMLGVPAGLQLMSVAFAKMGGDDDPDDKWFTWENEAARRGTDTDITPWLRHMANSHILYLPFLPTWGELKKSLPATVGIGALQLPLGALIPSVTGQEGPNATTRKRRYYLHFGKQGWEVARWFEDPTSSFLSKMSMPAQKVMEGVLGVTPATGWEKPFADLTFWERWTSLDPEKSALLNLFGAVTPFSVAGVERNPEAGVVSMVGVVGKGMSRTRAVNEMSAMFKQWGDADSYVATVKGRPGAWTDLQSMSTEWLDALRINGYDPVRVLKDAIDKARQPLYEKVHNALPDQPKGEGDIKALEEAARGLIRLDYIHANLIKSIKGRDKLQHIDRSQGDLGRISDEMLREAFFNSHGATNDIRARQSAMRGGDVASFLATDDFPKTVLGYRVVGPDQISEEDRAFFAENKEAAGFFKLD